MTSHPNFPQIQRRLAALGYYAGAIDDDWGPGMAGGIDKVISLVETARGIEPPPAPAPVKWAKLPAEYGWLRTIGDLPRHVTIGLGMLGTVETPGAASSPVIMGWRDECKAAGVDLVGYSADSVPWCGLFVATVMVRAQRPVPTGPLWALNWAKFGVDGGQPELGDVLTFQRPGGGHVAIYIAEDRQGYYHILGGNQGDKVSIMRIDKQRMHSCRQPDYKAKPLTATARIVGANGTISRNEA